MVMGRRTEAIKLLSQPYGPVLQKVSQFVLDDLNGLEDRPCRAPVMTIFPEPKMRQNPRVIVGK